MITSTNDLRIDLAQKVVEIMEEWAEIECVQEDFQKRLDELKVEMTGIMKDAGSDGIRDPEIGIIKMLITEDRTISSEKLREALFFNDMTDREISLVIKGSLITERKEEMVFEMEDKFKLYVQDALAEGEPIHRDEGEFYQD